jgi:N-acetylmuramoyl-L-alanine amidase
LEQSRKKLTLWAMLPLFALCSLIGAPAQWTVVLDPGHGGYQPGARGAKGLYEKHLTLQVAEAAKAELERRGHKVILTRDSDKYVSLGARSRFANEHKADVLVSIHANDAPRSPDAQGIETYFLAPRATDAEAQALAEKENDDPNAESDSSGLLEQIISDLKRSNAQIESEMLATRMQGALIRSTGAKSRGVKQAPLAVLKRTEMAAVLIEIGFLTHRTEREKLWTQSYQGELANGIADGIERFLGDSGAPELPPPLSVPLISLTDRQKRGPARPAVVAHAKAGTRKGAPKSIVKASKRGAKTVIAKSAPVVKKKPAPSSGPKRRKAPLTHAAR